MTITQINWEERIREHPLFTIASAIEGYKFRPPLRSKAGFDAEVERIIKHIEKNKDKLTPEQTATYEKVLADMAQEKNKTQNKKAASEQKTQNDASKAVKTPEKVSESEVQETSAPKTAKPRREDKLLKILILLNEKGMLKEDMAKKIKSYKAFSPDVAPVFHEMLSSNSDEDNKKIEELLSSDKELTEKFKKELKNNKKNNSTPTPTKRGENNMTDSATKDFQKQLEDSLLYKLAKELGIDINAYKAATQEEFNKVSDDIKNAVKEHQQKQTEEQRKNELEGLKKDKPELASEYEKIEKEDKPAPKTERETATVEDKKGTDEEENSDSNWIAEKMKFWKDYAKEKSLTTDFNKPEGDPSKVYCKLSNGEKEEGLISYTSEKDIQISKESSLTIYQGLVKDAVKSNLSITFGKSLNETQQLMLYAAVLLSEDKYEGTDEKAQVLNPPPLDKLIKSDAFNNLPDEAQKVLKVKYHVQRLREVVKNPAAHLSPEELKKRQAKKDEIDKINAARFGITGEYKTKYDHDVKIKEGKEEKIIHKKGDERIVTPDKDLFKEDGKLKSAYSQQTYDALLKRKKELEGK